MIHQTERHSYLKPGGLAPGHDPHLHGHHRDSHAHHDEWAIGVNLGAESHICQASPLGKVVAKFKSLVGRNKKPRFGLMMDRMMTPLVIKDLPKEDEKLYGLPELFRPFMLFLNEYPDRKKFLLDSLLSGADKKFMSLLT